MLERAPIGALLFHGGRYDQIGSRHHRRLRHLRSAGPCQCSRATCGERRGASHPARCASARSADCRSCSCRATDAGHRLSPSDINYRANIDALKRVGVTDLVSVSACGSFKEDLPPGSFVLVDQFIDRTFERESSFFGKGLRRTRLDGASGLAAAAASISQQRPNAEGIAVTRGGTYVCHGRAAILHAGREPALPALGLRR